MAVRRLLVVERGSVVRSPAWVTQSLGRPTSTDDPEGCEKGYYGHQGSDQEACGQTQETTTKDACNESHRTRHGK